MSADKNFDVVAEFLRISPWVRGFLLGLLPNEADAQDVFQELFVAVTGKAHTFTAGTNFLAWVRVIARNKALERLRNNRRGPMLIDDALFDLMAQEHQSLDSAWEERRRSLERCIEELAPRARQILEWRYAIEPLKPPEIATRLSWTVEAVHVALSRARKFLRDCTAERLALSEGTT